MDKISVIMPVYNETIKELKSSINSIENQTYRNFEFIIVDDNPKSKIIKDYLVNRKRRDNRIRLIFNKKNLGAMLSANRALSYSTGDYIARMDADDISCKNRLRLQLYFSIKYKLDFVCCNYCGFNKIYRSNPVYPKITQIDQSKIKHLMSYTNIATGPTLFFRRNILYKIGMYRNILCEDYDIAIRVLCKGYRMGYLSNVLVLKRERQNNLSHLNSLKEFVACCIISKFARRSKFTKYAPTSYLYLKLNHINKKDFYKFNKFLEYSKKVHNYKSLVNLFMKYFYALSSKLMIKRSLLTHFSPLIQHFLLK